MIQLVLLALSFDLSVDQRISQIAPGVWMREGDLKTQGHCNNAIIRMKDYVVIVDSNFPSGAEIMIAAAKKLVPDKPVKYVLVTHHHGDHAYGNAVWTKAGATTVSSDGVLGEIKRYEPARWQKAAQERADVRALNAKTLEPPRETFSKSPWVLDDGTRRVEFWHFGWGHTRGDGFIYLPKEKILVTGDAIVNGPHNFTGDSSLESWPKVLEKVRKQFAVDKVLPGHGPAGGADVIDGQIKFLTTLRAEVAKQVKAGRKLEHLVELKGEMPVKAKLTFSDPAIQKWIGGPLPGQIRDAFREVTTGKPAGDLPH